MASALALGLLLVALPQMYGVGYPVLESAIRGEYLVGFLGLLLLGKMVATSLTIAIGGSGGVFVPSLFIGAMLGTGHGDLAQRILPGLLGAPGAYGLVGMAAVFAAASRAPMTAVIIIFELTGEYQIILPLMLAVALATAGSSLLSADTIYTLKFRRRGIDITAGRGPNVMQILRVGDATRPVPSALPQDPPLSAVFARLAQAEQDALPVVDRDGRYRGVVTSRQLESVMTNGTHGVSAADLAQQAPTLTVDQRLEHALNELVRDGVAGLPVVDDDARNVVGWLIHRDVLRAYHARLQASGQRRDADRHVGRSR